MLDKTSRNFLKFIVNTKPNGENGLFTDGYVSKKLGLSKEETFDCIRFLDGEGLLRCVYVDQGIKHLHGFAPNHCGRHYAEFARKEFCKAILESVLLPILVSVITALIVAA